MNYTYLAMANNPFSFERCLQAQVKSGDAPVACVQPDDSVPMAKLLIHW